MSEFHKDLHQPVDHLQSLGRQGMEKFQCIHCKEKFKQTANAVSHLVKHPIPVSERKGNLWKKHYVRLC